MSVTPGESQESLSSNLPLAVTLTKIACSAEQIVQQTSQDNLVLEPSLPLNTMYTGISRQMRRKQEGYEKQGRLCEAAPECRLACRPGGYLVNFCLASEEDEHIPSGFIEVDMHGSVHSGCQVVLCMVLLAVHYLNIKGPPRHSEDRTVVEVGTELLPV